MLTAGFSAELENLPQQRQTGSKRVKSSLEEVHQLTQGLIQLEGLQSEQSVQALILPGVSICSSYLWVAACITVYCALQLSMGRRQPHRQPGQLPQEQ